MRLALIGLAACWSNPPPKGPPSAQPPEPVAAVAAEPPPRAYQLPAAVADALASEPLGGYVVVSGDAQLMATAATARTGNTARRGAAILGRVVKDHGDVVELETDTKRVQDCVGSFTPPYQLTVFVRRDQLVPRTKVEVTKTFADGTAVAIDQGTPVAITPAGLTWTGKLAELPAPPLEDQLAYSLLVPGPSAKLPAQKAEPLVCEPNESPRTLAEWRDARQAKRAAEARAREEARRIEMEAQKAEWERQRPERERAQAEALKKCKAKAAAKKKKAKLKDGVAGLLGEMDNCALTSIFGSGGLDGGFGTGIYGDALGAAGPSMWEQERLAPYCSINEPWDDGSSTFKKAAAPKLNGKPMPWPDDRTLHVVQDGRKYLADIDYGCGRVRLSVDDESALTGAGRGMGYGSIGMGSQPKVQVWIPARGQVTWPDGTPAGRYTGHKRYQNVEERDTRICVKVPGVGDLVCHEKATAKTEMVSPSMLRDRD